MDSNTADSHLPKSKQGRGGVASPPQQTAGAAYVLPRGGPTDNCHTYNCNNSRFPGIVVDGKIAKFRVTVDKGTLLPHVLLRDGLVSHQFKIKLLKFFFMYLRWTFYHLGKV